MMQSPADRPPPLSIYRAFVVQFRAETDIAHGRCTGRVEHVASGQTTQFYTLADLLAFIAHVLAQVQRQHADEP